MALLDQKTITVAQVSAGAEPNGHIVIIEYYNPATGLWQAFYPTGVPVGSSIGVRTTFRNDSIYTQSMDVFVVVTPPTALPFDIPGGSIPVAAGAEAQALTSWTADEVGTWEATVSLGGVIA